MRNLLTIEMRHGRVSYLACGISLLGRIRMEELERVGDRIARETGQGSMKYLSRTVDID